MDKNRPWTDTETEHVIDTEYRDGKWVPVGRVITEKRKEDDPGTVTVIEEAMGPDGVFYPVKVVKYRRKRGDSL